MHEIQDMPSNNEMLKNDYSMKNWLKYYLNIWTRNLAANIIDINTDVQRCAIDPEEMVEHYVDRVKTLVPVKDRLESRKAGVAVSLEIIASIQSLLPLTDEEIAAKFLSPEFLAPAEEKVEGEKISEEDGGPTAPESTGNAPVETTTPEEQPVEEKPEGEEAQG